MTNPFYVITFIGMIVLGIITWCILDTGQQVFVKANSHPAGIVVYSDGERHYTTYEDLLKGTSVTKDEQGHAYTPIKK